VGNVILQASQSGDADYAPATLVRQTLAVNKAKLTVTATSVSMKQGVTVPALTYAITGFVNGDTQQDATTGQPRLSTTATSKSAPGSYPITITGGSLYAERYTFAFVDNTLAVTK